MSYIWKYFLQSGNLLSVIRDKWPMKQLQISALNKDSQHQIIISYAGKTKSSQ
jgi:hypothetical protein